TPGDRTLLEEAEAQLLRLYLHQPEHRAAIRAALESRDLEFSIAHHRLLWQQILEIEEVAAAQDAVEPNEPLAWHATPQLSAPSSLQSASPPSLLSRLQDSFAELPGSHEALYSLFQLDEKTRRDLARAALVIRTATACMEMVMCEKRRRHFLDLWKKTDIATSPELGQYYQQQLYLEDQRIKVLEQEQRKITFADLAQSPWVGVVE
ncbi:MAG: hypothetical protein SNJ81_00715, partial [Cyanobacteriota bacterium]